MLLMIASMGLLPAQNATVKGYVFEEGNRGYLNMVLVEVIDPTTSRLFEKVYSNIDGYFSVNVPANTPLRISFTKEMFEPILEDLNLEADMRKDLSIKMKRMSGYVFEVTLAEKKDNLTASAKAITGARLEIYNNTTKKVMQYVDSMTSPEFKLNFIKGNHYTIMIRKPGYLTKRLEAYVNVKGCILCFDGVGDVRPGVVDNLSGNNEIGVLLANVEMDKVAVDKVFEIRNLYYEVGKSTLTPDSQKELDNLAAIANNNPQITFEVGSHTDSRGDAQLNLKLSNERSKSVVNYLINSKNVSPNQIVAQGYGETNLVNGCKDGVICTEVEYAANRRTELKILSIDTQFIPKSLEQIITIEDFEKSLLQDQVKVVKVPDEEPIDPVKASTAVILKTDEETEKVITKEIPKSQVVGEVKGKNENVKKQVTGDTSTKITEKKWLVRAGKFANMTNAQSIADKIYLLGYPKVKIVKEDRLFVVQVGHYDSEESANDVVKDLTMNNVDALVESIIVDGDK